MKQEGAGMRIYAVGRAPRGARGLKPALPSSPARGVTSRPARGAWIETIFVFAACPNRGVAPRAGRVD